MCSAPLSATRKQVLAWSSDEQHRAAAPSATDLQRSDPATPNGLNLNGGDELSAHDLDDGDDELSGPRPGQRRGPGIHPSDEPAEGLADARCKQGQNDVHRRVHLGQHRGAPQSTRRDRDRQSDAVGRPVTDARQRHPAEQGLAGEAKASEKPRLDRIHSPGGLR